MKKPILFHGIGTALVTPFRDGGIDYPALDRLIEEQIAAGIDALVVGGTTGEAATLTDTERYTLYAHALERVAARVPVLLGTGTNDTRVAILHTKTAEKLGADGALVVTPYYNKGTKEGVVSHFLRIADETNIPLLLYNVPGRTGVCLSEEQIAKLATHPRIVGIKEATDSVERLVHIAAMSDRLALYAGEDIATLPVFALGGCGVISVLSNLCPARMRKIYLCALAGDAAGARREVFALAGLMKVMFSDTNPAPVKYALSLLGRCENELRLPLEAPDTPTRVKIREEMRRAGLLSENGFGADPD